MQIHTFLHTNPLIIPKKLHCQHVVHTPYLTDANIKSRIEFKFLIVQKLIHRKKPQCKNSAAPFLPLECVINLPAMVQTTNMYRDN